MEIVINIPKETYIHLCNGGNIGSSLMIENAIKNGTPLPKGHGDLIDRDEVEKLEEALCATECGCCALDGCFYDRADVVIKADRSKNET